MNDLTDRTADSALLTASISALGQALADGQLTATGLTQSYLARIAAKNPRLNAFITVTEELALKQAAESDARRAKGVARGPLDGIPIALKDNIDVARVPTTVGIAAYRNRTAAEDAPVAARLREAGAVFLGKLNMHEGAHGATTANEAYGYCHNPYKHGYTPGGSSGGSGAALAAGLCAAALGTDTLGSIRIPASFCGVAGLKPTYGLVSNRGVAPLAFALDHVGPMARSVEDLSIMLAVIAGFDGADASARRVPSRWTAEIPRERDLTDLTIGYLSDLNKAGGDTIDPAVAVAYSKTCDTLKAAGAELKPVSFDGYDPARIRPKALLLIEADLANVYADALSNDPAGFSEIFRAGIDYGLAQSAPKLAAAMQMIESVRPVGRRILTDVDAIVTPTTPVPAFSFDSQMPKTITTFTAFANYVGCPALSVPMGQTGDGLPLGFQIIAPKWEEARTLRIGRAIESA